MQRLTRLIDKQETEGRLRPQPSQPVRRAFDGFDAEKISRYGAKKTAALLAAYEWPGNVRQLENAMFRAVVLVRAL